MIKRLSKDLLLVSFSGNLLLGGIITRSRDKSVTYNIDITIP